MLADKYKYMILNCVKYTQSFLKKKNNILGLQPLKGVRNALYHYKSSRISNTLDAVSHKIS